MTNTGTWATSHSAAEAAADDVTDDAVFDVFNGFDDFKDVENKINQVLDKHDKMFRVSLQQIFINFMKHFAEKITLKLWASHSKIDFKCISDVLLSNSIPYGFVKILKDEIDTIIEAEKEATKKKKEENEKKSDKKTEKKTDKKTDKKTNESPDESEDDAVIKN